MTLRDLAHEKDDVLRPFGQLDVLLLYAVVAEATQDYFGDRELASKILIPDGPVLIKRGSELPPLTAAELSEAVDEEFLRQRNELENLDNAREEVTDLQERVWQYFYPRKYSALFYATNYEGEQKPIDRIFFDIDRGFGRSAWDAQRVAQRLARILDDEPIVEGILDQAVYKWTGASFHIELLLTEPQPPEFYTDHIFDAGEGTLTSRAAERIDEQMDFPVVAGHENVEDTITIDPSQTPSGKLDRAPLGSLHMKDAETVDGVSLPLTRDELEQTGALDMVDTYDPRTVIEDLEELAAKL